MLASSENLRGAKVALLAEVSKPLCSFCIKPLTRRYLLRK